MDNIYLKILTYLKTERNFEYNAYHFTMLERRIKNRITQTTAKSPDDYLQYLKNTPDELDKLIDNFMINVSHFFRDPLCFEFVAKCILPNIIDAKIKEKENTLRIWSAGCSKGEEAYSIAIMLKEYIEREKIKLNIDLFATDFDAGAINTANRGIYAAESMKEVKLGFVDKYFTATDGKYTVNPGLKTMIRFSVYDLLDKHSYAPSESIFGDFDLVLCRNVLIYFNQEFQEIIFSKLLKSMKPKGILMLGETEAPISQFKEKFVQKSKFCKIYEKM